MSERRILVDADACPVRKEVSRLAGRRGIEVVYFANTAQMFRTMSNERIVTVSDQPDAADFAMVNECREGDIAVTDDVPLASMLVPRGVVALSSRGKQYRADQMPGRLALRHVAQQARLAGEHTRGPKALADRDRQRFTKALADILSRA